jgi:uncharacterized OB-fold protein
MMAATLGSVRRDGTTAEFLDGAARGEFLLRRCSGCGTFGGPQEGSCPGCGSLATDWVPASGRARVVSWSVVHGKGPDGGTAPQAIIVIAEFDEGPWWWSQLVDADPAAVATGSLLEVAFAPAEGGETLPVFRLA